MRLYLTSLGCKLNQAEIEDLARRALAAGCAIVPDPADADWSVINTCAVTSTAARKSRQLARHLRRLNPGLRVALIGCYADIAPQEAAALAGVQVVLPNARKGNVLAEILARAGQVPDQAPLLERSPVGGPLSGGHTRAFVKIQDGCDHACAYCVVHIARGPSRSRSAEEVLAEARARLAEGYREIVLTGVNIGAYGRDFKGWSLARLTAALLALQGHWRLRLSSIEPWDVTDDLIALWPHPRLCRHVHLPLQSGSDAVLGRMGRGYTTADYAARVDALRRRAAGLALTTDIIVGFPGETVDDCEATVDLVQRCRFLRLHVFPFSARPGTPAAAMGGQVPAREIRRRAGHLMALGRRLAEMEHALLVGSKVPVLLESREPGGWVGLTDTYIRAWATSDREDLHNAFVTVRVERADAQGVRGALVQADFPAPLTATNQPPAPEGVA